MDIRIIIQRSLIYTLLLALCVTAYLSILTLAQFLFSAEGPHMLAIWSAGITSLIGIFTVPIIEKWFRRITDKLFFKDRFDYPSAIQQLGGSLQADEMQELIPRLETQLAEILRATRICIVTAKIPHAPHTDLAELSIPFRLDGEEGRILLGPKLSGDPYTVEDQQLIETFASLAGLALSRTRLYEEVRRHANRLEEEVEERTKDLRASQEAQRQMVVDLSHNLQTPLAVLQAKAERLKSSGKMEKTLLDFEQSISSLSEFIYELLALAGLEQKLSTEAKEEIDLSLLIEELVQEMEIITYSAGIRIESDIQKDIAVIANQQRLREAIMNVAHNAVKYIGEGEKKIITFRLAKRDGMAILSIADTGPGIPPEELPKIFRRFYRASSSKGGTGLGLAIAREIIEKHGGTLEAESQLGEGSTFSFLMPMTSKKTSL